jgi:hypothetical protein
MKIGLKRSLSCLIVLSLLVIGGFASAQALTHESQHAHHQKATHGTVLCSWMCAAGQAGEATTVLVPSEVIPYEFIELIFAVDVQSTFSSYLSTRGPPHNFAI